MKILQVESVILHLFAAGHIQLRRTDLEFQDNDRRRRKQNGVGAPPQAKQRIFQQDPPCIRAGDCRQSRSQQIEAPLPCPQLLDFVRAEMPDLRLCQGSDDGRTRRAQKIGSRAGPEGRHARILPQ
jgi:hypothetical protein